MITKKQIHWRVQVNAFAVAVIAIVATQVTAAHAQDYGTHHGPNNGYRNNGVSVQFLSGYGNYGRNTGTYLQIGPGIGYGGTHNGYVPRYNVPPYYVPRYNPYGSGYSSGAYRPSYGYGNGRCH